MSSALTRIAGRVWLYPSDPDPDRIQASVGVIADDRGSVIVDAGHSPDLARRVQAAMAAEGIPPARWLVYTHHHWDHVWGAVAWGEVDVVAHSSARSILEGEAARPWSHAYLRAGVERNPRLGPSFRARARAMPSWESFAIRPPTTVFDTELTLPAGVELRHVGGAHAIDSLVVTVPDSGVLLLGDCFYPPPLHLREQGDGLDLDMVRSLLHDDIGWYVDAHSPPWSAADAAAMLAE
jgi:glyoxylase-like metal-dependent hydrolase (beta-lactamase superfamily II)